VEEQVKRTALKRKTALTRRTSIKRVSAKRKVINAARSTFVRDQLAKRTMCEAGDRWTTTGLSSPCTGTATEMHEPLTRARAPGAETILSEANSVAVCHACHLYIHSHPAAATLVGLLVSGKPGLQ
jgi:hypothetical protein